MANEQANREIGAVLASLVDAWNRHDVKAYVAHWTEDADFVNVVGFHRIGRAEIEAEIAFLHAGRFRNTRIQALEHTVRFLTPEVAVIRLKWRMDGDPGIPGHPSQDGTRFGILTNVAQRTAQGWRFVATQNTDVQPIEDFLKTARPTAARTA